MSRKITIYAGSFKPPHKGHLTLVKKMLKMTKPVKDGYPNYVYIFISKKERDPCNKLTGEISRYVWKEYIKTLAIKDQSRVKLIVSQLASPVQTSYGFVKKIAKKDDTFYLVKSAKDASNTRFNNLLSLKKKNAKMAEVKMIELVLSGYENLHSTNMRKTLHENNKKDFAKYIPKMVDKNKMWNKLKKLC